MRELAVQLDVPKSAVGRILQLLQTEGYATQDALTGRYRLGPKATILGRAYADRQDLLKVAHPVMERLSEVSRETVSLNVRFELTRVCVAQIESPQELRAAGAVGQTYPLDAGAPGRVLLAALSDEQIRYVLAHRRRLRPYPANRPLSNKEILRLVEETRHSGFAFANQETMRGVCSLAVQIRGQVGSVVGALGLLIPYGRYKVGARQTLQRLLEEASHEIERTLGFMGRPRDKV